MPRGVYDRTKSKPRAKRVAMVPTGLLPEVVHALSDSLAVRLPDGLIPYVSTAGEVRLFKLERSLMPPRWTIRLLSPAETDAVFMGQPAPELPKKRGRKPKAQPGAAPKGEAARLIKAA
jgi:hypothetical protein